MTAVPTNPEHVRFLLELAQYGRRDIYANWYQGPKGKSAYKPTKVPLDENVILRHLSGVQPVGIYLLDGDKTRLAVFDLDAHKVSIDFAGMIRLANSIVEQLTKVGLKPFLFRSGGGKGIHIWIVWKEPQPAVLVRSVMKKIAASAGFEVGTGSAKHGKLEIFPKQDRATMSNPGNLIALPLSRDSAPFLADKLTLVKTQDWIPPNLQDLCNTVDLPAPPIDKVNSSNQPPIGTQKTPVTHIPSEGTYH